MLRQLDILESWHLVQFDLSIVAKYSSIFSNMISFLAYLMWAHSNISLTKTQWTTIKFIVFPSSSIYCYVLSNQLQTILYLVIIPSMKIVGYFSFKFVLFVVWNQLIFILFVIFCYLVYLFVLVGKIKIFGQNDICFNPLPINQCFNPNFIKLIMVWFRLFYLSFSLLE